MSALPQLRSFPTSAQVYGAGAIASSLIMVAAAWYAGPLVWTGSGLAPLTSAALPVLLYLAIGTQIAALLPIRWRNGVQTVMDPILVATGLYAPGFGVGLVVWLATFDGRVPGKTNTWWGLRFT